MTHKIYTKLVTTELSKEIDYEMPEACTLESLTALSSPASFVLLAILDKAKTIYSIIDTQTFPTNLSYPKLATSGNAPIYDQYVIPAEWWIRLVSDKASITYGWVLRSLKDYPGRSGGR